MKCATVQTLVKRVGFNCNDQEITHILTYNTYPNICMVCDLAFATVFLAKPLTFIRLTNFSLT